MMTPFELASLIGSVAFALSGFFLGVRKELDWMGLFIVAMLTANGGGAVRDVLVGHVPGVLQNPSAFYLVLGVVAGALLLRLHRYPGLERRAFFVISDSVGLVAFSITGAMVALQAELSIFGVLLLALLTATGGGIIRDVLLNEVPAVLDSGFYGSVALIIGAVMFVMDHFQVTTPLWLGLLFVAALALRLIAHWRSWHLPRIRKGAPYLDGGQ